MSYYVQRTIYMNVYMNLNVTKSSGVDGISARMLKLTAVSIVTSLAKLFNLSVRTGTFPDDLKTCKGCIYSQTW